MNVVEKPRSGNRKPSRPARRSGVIVPHQPTWYQRLGAAIIAVALRTVMMTLRYSWNDPSGVLKKRLESPAIFVIWHNRLALSMEAFRVFSTVRHGKGLAALVSASKDGGFLAAILENFKIQPVRGSSSRRGPQALLELRGWAERGYDLAITPDGPRGPCYVVQPGVIAIAHLTGLPVIPFSCELQWKIQVKSWDRFQIPLPFSRCRMNVGTPIRVPKETTDEQRAELRQNLESKLMEISGS